MSLEPSSPSLLGHPLCLPARAVPPSSRAPSPDLPPTHSPGPGLGAAGELCGLGPSPEEVQTPLAFLASAPSQAAGLWNSPASHLTDGDTEAQKVSRLVISEAGFKLTSVGFQASTLPATQESFIFSNNSSVNNKPVTLRSTDLTQSSLTTTL